MKITLENLELVQADLIVIPVFSNTENISISQAQDIYSKIKKSNDFHGQYNEILPFTTLNGENLVKYLFIGLGKEEKLNNEKLRKSMTKLVSQLKGYDDKKIYIELIKTNTLEFANVLSSMIEGLTLSSYKFNNYKSSKKTNNVEIYIGNIDKEKINEAKSIQDELNVVLKSNFIARDMVNEPANDLTPEKLAKLTEGYGKECGFEVEILDEKAIADNGMEAFLAVAKGSENKPRLIIMRYFGNNKDRQNILGLVGKGLTYDSGGYSLKGTGSMLTMKSDMAGAAAVIGAMMAIASRKLEVNVVSVVAACENLISSKAYKPGDIIGSMAGKTIEVANTDAEGRITLADAVYYTIKKEKVSKIIDIATLTGAALVALGTKITAVLTNDSAFYDKLKLASNQTGEKIWQLPAEDEYKELIDSKIADLKNVGGRDAVTIVGGLFIKQFIDNTPWLHLDIAGTSWTDKAQDYYSVGGTGVGVRLLYNFAKIY